MSEKAKEILKNIKDRKIKPTSRWKILLKDYLFWFLFLFVTLVGALAISVIIFIIRDNDWDIYNYLNKSLFGYVLFLIPYFWLVILFFLGYLAYFNLKNTRKGYLLNPYWVVIGSVFISVVLGWFLFELKIGNQIDKLCAEKIPYYKGTESYKKDLWSHPESGLLAGEIMEFNQEGDFIIKDLSDKKWDVLGKEAVWSKETEKEVGERVKIIGGSVGESKFKATEVRPWSCHCKRCANGDVKKSEGCISQRRENPGHSCND